MKEGDKKERLLALSALYVHPARVSLMKSFMTRTERSNTDAISVISHPIPFNVWKARGRKEEKKKGRSSRRRSQSILNRRVSI